jgi:hypothetical protein
MRTYIAPLVLIAPRAKIAMRLYHSTALVLIAWLLLPLPLRAAGPVAVPGTADVPMGWYLMSAPAMPTPGGGYSIADSTAPISRWLDGGKPYQTKKERDDLLRHPQDPFTRCISADDLAHAKAIHAPGWLLMMAPHDDATAPLAQWTITRIPGFEDEDRPRPPPRAQWASVYNFSSEKACNFYRNCLYGEGYICATGFVIRQPSIFDWWSEMRERRRRHKKFLGSRCVPDDDPRLKETQR